MIYKVFYQDGADNVPIREATVSFFLRADSERDVRKKLKDRDINIEYIQLVEKELLAYEEQNEDFKVLEI